MNECVKLERHGFRDLYSKFDECELFMWNIVNCLSNPSYETFDYKNCIPNEVLRGTLGDIQPRILFLEYFMYYEWNTTIRVQEVDVSFEKMKIKWSDHIFFFNRKLRWEYDEWQQLKKSPWCLDFIELQDFYKDRNSYGQHSENDVKNVLIGSLLKRMGLIALNMDSLQMRVFNVYKAFASQLNQEDCRLYAFRIMLPLYKVCQGFTGKVITDELKQLAEDVRDNIY
ncbi:T7N9.4 [Arabidopsis thaliana]|uniref:T7N9.4 n=1 Tax=Arabidopsis thaliana TaxID=3702 RepID=Q9LFY7_ARATH|nr:T7N9.4 [Arabidopsis thaliana]